MNQQQKLSQLAFPIKKAPPLFNFARFLIQSNVRGGWRLWLHLIESGALNQIELHELDGPVRAAPLLVPLYRKESSWSEREVARYEHKAIEAALAQIARIDLPVVYIDCGADIGLVASAIARQCANLESIIAYEPNAEAHTLLAHSFRRWSVEARAINAAVGARRMRGRLTTGISSSAHAQFIVEDPEGSVEVRRVDDESIPEGRAVLLKIDVEGLEFEVASGAVETLRRAPAFVVMFEAHPRVFERTGVDPCETIRLIRSIAPIDVSIAERPGVSIDPDAPFFAQLGAAKGEICNVICAARRN